MNNEPVAWMYNYENFPDSFVVCRARKSDQDIPLYAHPVKEQSTNERIEMLKEMVEKSANPAGWIGYHEGHLVSFLQTQEQVDSFLKNTDTAGRVKPVYTHPVKEQDESFDRTASHMAGEYVSYPVKELTLTDAEISDFTHRMVLCCGVHPNSADINVLGLKFIVEEILRKAQDERN